MKVNKVIILALVILLLLLWVAQGAWTTTQQNLEILKGNQIALGQIKDIVTETRSGGAHRAVVRLHDQTEIRIFAVPGMRPGEIIQLKSGFGRFVPFSNPGFFAVMQWLFMLAGCLPALAVILFILGNQFSLDVFTHFARWLGWTWMWSFFLIFGMTSYTAFDFGNNVAVFTPIIPAIAALLLIWVFRPWKAQQAK